MLAPSASFVFARITPNICTHLVRPPSSASLRPVSLAAADAKLVPRSQTADAFYFLSHRLADCDMHTNSSTCSKNELSMRWPNASDTGDAARTPSPHCNDLNPRGPRPLGSSAPLSRLHAVTRETATVVSRQVERNPLSRLLAHDPMLTLTCIFAPANDRDDMVSATSRGGNDPRFPVQERHRIDATSNWTALITSQHPENVTHLENIIGPCRKR